MTEIIEVFAIHGSASSPAVWDQFCAQAPKGVVVHAIELPGYGGSALELFAPQQDLISQVASKIELSTSRYHLVGIGFGGAVAQALADRYRENVLSLSIYETVLVPRDWRDIASPFW